MFEKTFSFYIHGGNSHEGLSGYLEYLLLVIEKLFTQGPEAISSTFFPGLAAMPNFHPLIVHFPIAFLTVFFFLDVAGALTRHENWRRIASVLLYFGAVGVICAVVAGIQAASTISHGDAAHKVMETHEQLGLIVAFLTICLAIWRIIVGENLKWFANIIHLSIAALILIVMTLGADLGGLMVYEYGVGVSMDGKNDIRTDGVINQMRSGHSHH
jgi:uncharacterized membrane protein